MTVAETDISATATTRIAHARILEPCLKVVESHEALRGYIDAWTHLATVALEPNVFYEPWTLLPALDVLPEARHVVFVLVFGRPDPSGPVALTGFFPLFIRKLPYRIPISIITTWIHKYCFLSVPLLHRDCARQTLESFLTWLTTSPYNGRIFDLRLVPGDGPFQSLLAELLTIHRRHSLIIRSFPRAVLRPPGTFEAYSDALSGKLRRELKSKNKQLAELGRYSYASVKTSAEVEEWVSTFIRMEASGWKRKEGGSFSNDSVGSDYLFRILRNGLDQKRALMTTSTLDSRPIAMQCTLLANGGGFGFITTYDEAYAKYSPGALLTLENTRTFCDLPSLQWVDSCAQCDHPLFNRLWHGRRMVQRIIASDGTAFGNLLIAASPQFRYLRDSFRKRRHFRLHSATHHPQ